VAEPILKGTISITLIQQPVTKRVGATLELTGDFDELGAALMMVMNDHPEFALMVRSALHVLDEPGHKNFLNKPG
jgi:hypothetical protein